MATSDVDEGTLEQDMKETAKSGVSSQIEDGVMSTDDVDGRQESGWCHMCHVCLSSALTQCDAGVMNQRCRQCCSNTCTASNVKKKLPILNWLPTYR